jgi:tripartite-type tricarboxylate transporter receptor subunit TctC
LHLRIFALIAVVIGALVAPAAYAQKDYPSRPVKFLVPYPPGGGNDILARILAEKLTERLGRSFYIENVSGAGGNVGTAQAAKAAADGQTILMANNSFVMNTLLYANIPFDVRRDFVPTAIMATIPMILCVNPSVPVNSVQELIEYIRKTPDGMEYGTPGTGTPQHLAAELFGYRAGVKLRHIPYRGTGPAVNDAIAGHIKLLFATAASVEQHVKTGTLKALALTTAQRSPAFPDIPSIQESGVKDFDVYLWYGVLLPAKTPDAINSKLGSEIDAIMAMPDVQKKLLDQGYAPVSLDRVAFARILEGDLAKWGALVKSIGLGEN